MSSFPSNNMYYRHGGRSHDTHSSGSVGSSGQRPQFWNDNYTSYGKSDSYRQHNYTGQNPWQHQSFQQQQQQQQWSHSQWVSSNHQTSSFRKDQPHQKHSFKSGHHSLGPYKPKKSFVSYERGSSSFMLVKEEDPLPGSEEERKKMLAQETDKVKKCLMTFKNEQSMSGGTSDNREKVKSSADASFKGRRKDSESTVGTGNRDTKERGKSSSHITGSSQKSASSKEKERQSSNSGSAVKKQTSHSVNSSVQPASKTTSSGSGNEGNNKLTKKPINSGKPSSSSQSGKPISSSSIKDNSQSGGSSHSRPSSKPEVNSVLHNKSSSQVSTQQKKNKSVSNIGTKQTVSSDVAHQDTCTTNISNENELQKICQNEDTDENYVQTKIKHLKDRIVRHVLGMTPNHLKDFINKPTSRRFEFAMKHLVKERQELMSKEQRGFANSRIHTQSTGSLDESEIQNENLCLDTNVTVDLGSLPPEVIEHLGNLLQVDLLKCVEKPNTTEENLREGYNDCIIDFENLKAFANTLPNNENIFDFIEEKPNIAEIAIKQEIVSPWEEVIETNSNCGMSSNNFCENSDDRILHTSFQDSQIPQNDHDFTKNVQNIPCSELEKNQVTQEELGFGTNIEEHILPTGLQESQLLQNVQGSEVNTTPLSMPVLTEIENNFHSLGEQHCTTLPDMDSWNKSVSTDLTLQSLELTEKLIDKIEQMTSVVEVPVSAENDLNDKQVNVLTDETDGPNIEEDCSENLKGSVENNLNTQQLTGVEITERTENSEEINGAGSLGDVQSQIVSGSEGKLSTEVNINYGNMSQKQGACDDVNSSVSKDTDAPDVEIITSEDNTIEKDIEIITIPDDEHGETCEKPLDDQVEIQDTLFDSSDSKMDVNNDHIEENLKLSSNDVPLELQIRSELKTVKSYVETLEPPNNYIQTEDAVEEGALIHDKCLASAVIPETESCEEASVPPSPLESKFPSMSTITEDLVTTPNMPIELGDCEVSGSGLFGRDLNRLNDTARNLVENEPEDCKVLKDNEKEWSRCSASEMQYSHQGSGNAEFRNLFCELPDLEPEPADGEQQCQSGIVPDGIAASKSIGSGDAGSVANSRNTSESCATSTGHPSRFSPARAQVEKEKPPAIETSTQTELDEELTPFNVERMLQLLEKSHQLSPQLAKLLRDHFNLIKTSREKHVEPCPMSKEHEKHIEACHMSREQEKHIEPCSMSREQEKHIEPCPMSREQEKHIEPCPMSREQEKHIEPCPMSREQEKHIESCPMSREQEKHFESCRMSRERVREMWNGSKRDNKFRQSKIHSQHGSRANISNYICSRAVNESPSLIENSVEKVRDTEVSQTTTSPRGDSDETATDVEKTIFLEMLGIDKEIQRLMDQKLRLYMRLRLNMSGERLNVGHYSPRTPPPQERMSTQLCGMSTPISPIMNVPTDESELPQKDSSTMEQSVDKTLLRPPMVILPHSYEKPLYDENVDSTDNATCRPMLNAMFPRISGVNKRLKLMDTTVVEQVLNSFTIPDSQDKSASSKSDSILEVLGSVAQSEEYSAVGKEVHSSHSQETEMVDHTSKSAVDVEKRVSEVLDGSITQGQPRTKKNKAQSKYISEKIDHISTENIQSVSEAANFVADGIAVQKSPNHVTSDVSKSPHHVTSHVSRSPHHVTSHFSKSPHHITSHVSVSPHNVRSHVSVSPHHVTSHVSKSPHHETSNVSKLGEVIENESPLASSVPPNDDKIDMPSSEISVPASEQATAETCNFNSSESEVLSNQPEKNGNNLSENNLSLMEVGQINEILSTDVDKSNEEVITKEISKTSPKDVALGENEIASSKESLLDTKLVEIAKSVIKEKLNHSKQLMHESKINSGEKQSVTVEGNVGKAMRRKNDATAEVQTGSRNKVKSSTVKDSLSSEKSDKTLQDTLPPETTSNRSTKMNVVKHNSKAKASISDKDLKVSAEKSTKTKSPSSRKEKLSLVTQNSKRDKNEPTNEKYSRRSRQPKVDKGEPLSPVKSPVHGKTGKLDSGKVFSEESESLVNTELIASPRKLSSRSRTTNKKSPDHNLKEKPILPSVENEVSRTRRKGKRQMKADENVESLISEGQVSLSTQKEDSSPKKLKNIQPSKTQDDGRENEQDKEEKVIATRKGKQVKLNDTPAQNSADFTKPNSTPKKTFSRSRRTKESPVSGSAAPVAESDTENIAQEGKKITEDHVEHSTEASTRNKRKRSRVMEEELVDTSPSTKRTKVRETRVSMSEDDQDTPTLQGKRSTRLRRSTSRVESDQQGTNLDASDNTQSSGRRSLVRSARGTKPYTDFQTDEDFHEDNKKKRPRKISHSESVKSDASVMQVIEDVVQCIGIVDSEEINKTVEEVSCVVEKTESVTVPDYPLKACKVSLTRIRVDNAACSEDISEESDDCVNESLCNSLNQIPQELSVPSVNETAPLLQEKLQCEVNGVLPDAGLSVPEVRSDWTEMGTLHHADDVQSNCCTPSYAAADGCMDLQSFQVESMAMDDNSISTLVSDSVSMMSDCEQRKGRSDNMDCDHDSTHSAETVTESTSSQSSRHKQSRKHRREKKSDAPEHLTFETHTGPILHIKTVGRHVLAACEDGSVYNYSLKSGKFKGKYDGHTAAVTCLYVLELSPRTGGETPSDIDGEHESPAHVFTGSLDHYLRGFVFRSGEAVFDPQCIGSPIQCMEHNWGYLYLGTKLGEVARFNIEKSCLIGEHLKLSSESILSLIATKEGPRKVLIVGTRSSPIMVRDATNGLLLRSVSSHSGHTAYSLLLENSLVYCGTSTDAIRVFEFTSGVEVCQLKAGCSVVCMTSYNNMLFAGCYDGNIYVFSLQDKKHITTIAGPGKMLLCMDVMKKMVIAGCKEDNKLEAWSFPAELKTHFKRGKTASIKF